jgi:hypothetical protein|tara:strand:+ start:584 stop:1363 length:780 start_codon:yes stop_codon:yes gene_type:complete
MGFFGNAASRIRNKLRRGAKDTQRAVKKESQALKIETQEEEVEEVVQKEIRGISASWKNEAALIKDLGFMHNSKYTKVKALIAVSAAKRNLSEAKKRLFSTLLRSGKRVAMLSRAQVAKGVALGARGALAAGKVVLAPGLEPGQGSSFDYAINKFSANVRRTVSIQEKELQLLAHEVQIQINENRERLEAIKPVAEKNRQIRDKLGEYSKLLGKQNMQLSAARTNVLKEIRKEREEITAAKEALYQELDALKQTGGVPH